MARVWRPVAHRSNSRSVATTPNGICLVRLTRIAGPVCRGGQGEITLRRGMYRQAAAIPADLRSPIRFTARMVKMAVLEAVDTTIASPLHVTEGRVLSEAVIVLRPGWVRDS